MVEDILAQEMGAVREHVNSQGFDADLKEMVRVEEANQNREELVLWLLQKQQRHDTILDEERLQHALSHLEEAYRTAAISQDTYHEMKRLNRELLDEVN